MSWLGNMLVGPSFGAIELIRDHVLDPLLDPVTPHCLMPINPEPFCRPPSPLGQLSANQWTTANFVKHYYTGDGQAVDLADIGLLDDLQRSDSGTRIQTLWKESVTARIEDELEALRAQPGTETSTTIVELEEGFRYDVAKQKLDITNPLYSIAGGYLQASAKCTITFDPKTGDASWIADVDYRATDRFKEPLNINGVGPRWSMGGTPYDIKIGWNDRLTG